jgi:large subunit ribosomal protein L9
LGDVVKVKDGFARNFLIPHGKAKRATSANLAEFEQRRAELEAAQAAALAAAQEKGAKIDGMMLQVTQKAGVDGKLFGSVTSIDISEALKKQGFDVPKAAIRMPQGPIKTIGDHPLKVALHTDVVVSMTVSVLGEPA